MAFGSSDRYQGQTTMSEINVVPLSVMERNKVGDGQASIL